MPSLTYVVRRLALAAPLLLGMSLLVFGLMRVIPGDPAVVVLGYKATPESIRAMRETFHLDESLPTQYARWLAGILRGDFGIDFRQNEPIGRMIVERLPVTIELTLLAALAAALIENLWYLALPTLTLASSRAAALGRLTRAAVLDVVHRPFVQFARAKGLSESAILMRHVLPNAAIPIVTVIGLQVGYMLGGAIVVETIFTLPGLGRMTLDAVLERNYPVVQSGLLVVGAMFMVVNLVTDVLYGLIDPRLRRR